jgi:esterase/lipase superfamily enzyme
LIDLLVRAEELANGSNLQLLEQLEVPQISEPRLVAEGGNPSRLAIDAAVTVAKYFRRPAVLRNGGEGKGAFASLVGVVWKQDERPPNRTIQESALIVRLSLLTLIAFCGSDSASSRRSTKARTLIRVQDWLRTVTNDEDFFRESGSFFRETKAGSFDPLVDANGSVRIWDALAELLEVHPRPAIGRASLSTHIDFQALNDKLRIAVDRVPVVASSKRVVNWVGTIVSDSSYSALSPRDNNSAWSPRDDNFDGGLHTVVEYPVFFGTDRPPVVRGGEVVAFRNNRDADPLLRTGVAVVGIPKNHRFGQLELPWYKKWWQPRTWGDGLSVGEIRVLDAQAFSSSLNAYLDVADAEAEERSILLYIHGYNTSFNDATRRAAQIGYDLRVEGASAVYSWPSKAKIKAYGHDATAAESSQVAFAQFLSLLLKETQATRINVVAHSMGNRVLLEVLKSLEEEFVNSGVQLGRLILAAPDMDVVRFKALAAVYPALSLSTTLYVSNHDLALRASGWLRDFQRVGYAPPIAVVPGVDTISVGRIDLSLLGHGYFVGLEALLHDMNYILSGKVPKDRPRVVRSADGSHWEMLP